MTEPPAMMSGSEAGTDNSGLAPGTPAEDQYDENDVRKVTLVSAEMDRFEVEIRVIKRSLLIKGMIEDIGEISEAIPLPNVSSAALAKVLQWYRVIHVSEWDSKFIRMDSDKLLFEVMMAANYLDIKPLLNVGIKTVADELKGKTTEQMRERYDILNDFTPDEEAQIRKEDEWPRH